MFIRRFFPTFLSLLICSAVLSYVSGIPQNAWAAKERGPSQKEPAPEKEPPQTAEEAILRISDNFSRILDFSASAQSRTVLNGEEVDVVEQMRYLFQAPDKIRIETPSNQKTSQTGETILMVGSRIYAKDETAGSVTEADMLEGQELGQGGFYGLHFWYYPETFIENHLLSMLQVDQSRRMVTVRAEARSANSIYSYLEFDIDYQKGLAYETRIYDAWERRLVEKMTVLESAFLEPGVWFPMVVHKEPVFRSGENTLVTIMTFSRIQLNQGISDTEFDPGVLAAAK
ncbi:MAG: hypothetical protein JW844_02445 [Candidatus Omnitrophica bacterium]|nr:hypothetical protein [Candidatus Omnitrophota bacterium]